MVQDRLAHTRTEWFMALICGLSYCQRIMFPQLAHLNDLALLLLRIMVGIVFMTSGWKHLQDPEGRSKDIGMSRGFTIFLGVAELAGSLGVILGVLAQLAAIGLILIMLGSIQKKVFVWRTGFWGESGTNGWSYDTMLIVMNLVIVTTGGGNLSVMK
jgi:putative oxidoreductase